MSESVRSIDVTRVGDAAAIAARDVAATEEPLEIRLHGIPFVVIMRTPGADRELAAGFLLSERIIQTADDIGGIRQCADPDAGELRNVLNVTLHGDAASRVAALRTARRATTSNSSCGICGRRSIDDLLTAVSPVRTDWRVGRELIQNLPDRLRAAQTAFDETGGLHAAGLFDRNGALVGCAEDVGRHNAVDKVIGTQVLMNRLPLDERILFVSGRTSFEIVQKAVVAGIPLVASVSAPSSLAIELAEDANITLLGFVRGTMFNAYTGLARLNL
jgi:FdhD protein